MTGEEIRELTCSGCGAPLPNQSNDKTVRCARCGKGHSSIYPPPATTAASKYKKGDAVAVSWGDRWWPARVTEVIGESRWMVRYDGWGPAFQEAVSPPRVRPLTPTQRPAEVIPSSIEIRSMAAQRTVPAAAKAGVLVLALLVSMAAGYLLWPSPNRATDPGALGNRARSASMAGAMPAPPNTREVTAHDALIPGQKVHILWEQAWFPGKILASAPNDKVKIHYEGWDNAYDEVVSKSRLRLPE